MAWAYLASAVVRASNSSQSARYSAAWSAGRSGKMRSAARVSRSCWVAAPALS
jgi:predicted NUDIX family NTP pyrophosphohydrolase